MSAEVTEQDTAGRAGARPGTARPSTLVQGHRQLGVQAGTPRSEHASGPVQTCPQFGPTQPHCQGEHSPSTVARCGASAKCCAARRRAAARTAMGPAARFSSRVSGASAGPLPPPPGPSARCSATRPGRPRRTTSATSSTSPPPSCHRAPVPLSHRRLGSGSVSKWRAQSHVPAVTSATRLQHVCGMHASGPLSELVRVVTCASLP